MQESFERGLPKMHTNRGRHHKVLALVRFRKVEFGWAGSSDQNTRSSGEELQWVDGFVQTPQTDEGTRHRSELHYHSKDLLRDKALSGCHEESKEGWIGRAREEDIEAGAAEHGIAVGTGLQAEEVRGEYPGLWSGLACRGPGHFVPEQGSK